jgi:hypothetical protein
LNNLGYKKNLTFKEVFNKKLCQDIVIQYWETFFNKRKFMFNANTNPQDVLRLIFTKYPKIKLMKAINTIGLYMLARDDDGLRGFRQIVDNHRPQSNWPVIKKYLKKLDDDIYNSPLWGFIDDIEQALNDFESYKYTNNNSAN